MFKHIFYKISYKKSIIYQAVLVLLYCLVVPALSSVRSYDEDFEKLKRDAEELLDSGVTFFIRNPVGISCNKFAKDPAWRRGPVHLQLLNEEGIMYFSNDYSDFIWRNETNAQNIFQKPLLQLLLSLGAQGGWVSHFALNSIQHGYIKIVKKHGRRYVLAAVFFYESPELVASLLVDGVKTAWARAGAQKIFSMVSNPYGSLVIGDAHVSIIDLEGKYWAHGANTFLIGQNILLDKGVDTSSSISSRTDLVKSAIEKTDNPSGQAWVEYNNHGMTRRVYAERLTDPITKKIYIVLSGYFPDLTEETVVSCAIAASKILEQFPKQEALSKLARARFALPDTVCKADLIVQITDAQGTIVAHTHDAHLVGSNAFSYVDERRNSLELLKTRLKRNGKAWMTAFRNNSFERIYARQVETQHGIYMVIVSGYFPYRREEIASAMVDDAFELFNNRSKIDAILDFKTPVSAFTPSMFVKGDMKLSIYDDKGICWFTARGVRDFWKQDEVITALPQGWVDDERNALHMRLHIKRLPKQVAPNKIENFTFVVSFHV